MIRYFAGIDVGSLSTDAVIVDSEMKIVAQSIIATGANSRKAAERIFYDVLEKSDLKPGDITSIISTGYGREIVPLNCERVTEITCHARGAYHLFPGTRIIIDVGGQDCKVIRINDRGKVLDFAMNDKCAAGTGRFLEVMARALEIELEEMGKKSLESTRHIQISSMCTVFAESEVVSLIAEGHSIPDIINGLHQSIASRIVSLAERVGLSPGNGEMTMTGGVAKNTGMVKALEEKLKMRLNIPQEPQTVGALGAALIALERATEAE